MPLSGVRVFLDDGDGIWESGEDWTISDGNGDYSFSDLQPPSYPAEYIVAQTEPARYEVTTPASPHTHTVTFGSEGDATDKDFSYTPNLPDKVDVFVLSDDTYSFDSEVSWVLRLFDLDWDDDGDYDDGEDDCLIEGLRTNYDSIDWGFGVGRFEDYSDGASYDRPFILNQPIMQEDDYLEGTPPEPTNFALAIDDAVKLTRKAPGLGGDDWESTAEALFQVATGLGFNGNNDEDTTDSLITDCLQMQTNPGSGGDVVAFSEYPADPTHYIFASDGTLGGVGFREDAIRIVVVATDYGTKYQEEDVSTETIHGVTDVDYADFTTDANGFEGTPYDKGAQIQETVTALNSLGILVIGVGDSGGYSRTMLESFSKATGAVNEGDTIVVGDPGGDDDILNGEPLYFEADGNIGDFAEVIEEAIESPLQCLARDISGNIWSDSNEDGVHDAIEQGMLGLTVYIDFDDDGELDAGELRVTTDASGDYVFENVVVGTAKVRVGLPTGWFTTPPAGSDYQLVNVQAGYALNRVDFGIHAVTAYDDSFTTPEDVPLDIVVSSLTGNDLPTVPSTSDAVYFSSVDDSDSVGCVSVDGSTLTYTPAENWNGTDTFLYSLTDGYDYTDWAIVTVEVTPVNDAPEVDGPWAAKVLHGQSVTVKITASDLEDDPLTPVIPVLEHGTVTADGATSFTYTADPDFVGVEYVTLGVSDGTTIAEHEVAVCVCDVVDGADDLGDAVWHAPTFFTAAHVGDTFGGTVAYDGTTLVMGRTNSSAYGTEVLVWRETEAVVDGVSVLQWDEPWEITGDATFGYSVAVEGDTLVIGEPARNSSQGCVRIYHYDDDTSSWEFQATLTAGDDAQSFAYFGEAVAINETADAIVVGAPSESAGGTTWAGAAYVFKLVDGLWTRDYDGDEDDAEGRIQPAGLDFARQFRMCRRHQRRPYHRGRTRRRRRGYGRRRRIRVRVRFQRTSSGIPRPRSTTRRTPRPETGWDVPSPISGDLAVVGAFGYDYSGTNNAGKAIVFDLANSTAQCLKPDGFNEFGDGVAAGIAFEIGRSVDICGDRIVIGTPNRRDGSNNILPGVVYQFVSGACVNPEVLNSQTVVPPANDFAETYLLPCDHTNLYTQGVALSGGGVFAGLPGYETGNNTWDEGGAVLIPYNRTPAAQDMELVVAGATGTSYQCGSVFGIDPFEGDAVSYSIIPAVPDDGYQEHGTFSFDDPANPEVVTYTPTAGLGYPVSDTFRYKVTDGDGAEDIAEVTVYFGSAQILNRGIFYAGDFGNARDISREADNNMVVGEDPTDDNDNIVTHPDGITGVIIDVAFPSDPEAFSPADFACLYYDGDSWETVVPTEISVAVIYGLEAEEGTGDGPDYDCHRVRLTFSPGIKNWLEVTMDDAALGVSQDRFYFGYLEGDATADGTVSNDDMNAIREYWETTVQYTVPVPGDINSDGFVSSADMDLVRENWLSSVSVPPAPVRGMAMASSSSLSSSRSSTSSTRSSSSSTPEWTAEADKVFADYGIGDDDLTNDLAIDEKFWERLYEALGLTW